MGISGISASDSMSGVRVKSVQTADTVGKRIQSEISDVQRQMQELSAKEDVPVEEKVKERQELQQEISRLNAQLRQHQEELSREQRKEALEGDAEEESVRQAKTTADERKVAEGEDRDAEAKAAEETAKEEETDRAAVSENMQPAVSVDASLERMKAQEKAAAKIESDIAILKGEISLDKKRGMNVEKKEEELARLEREAQKTAASWPPGFADSSRKMRESAQEADGKVLITATNFSIERNQTAQQMYTFAESVT